MLELREVDVHYGPVHAVRGVSLRVARGEIVALLGANGAGKSTTLRAVSGLVRPTRGAVLLEGESLAGLPAHRVVARGVVQSPEGRQVFPRMSVRENLTLGRPDATDDGVRAARDRLNAEGFVVPSMQALLFGTQGLHVFDEGSHAKLVTHLSHVARIGQILGARAAVFGSPRQRTRCTPHC